MDSYFRSEENMMLLTDMTSERPEALEKQVSRRVYSASYPLRLVHSKASIMK